MFRIFTMPLRVRILAILLLALFGCSGTTQTTQQQANETVCLNRQDLKLVLASASGDTASMETALKAGANVNTSIEDLGTPIVASAMSGNPKAVQLLLDKGANVQSVDNQGYTPLINAVLTNNKDIVQLLLSKGANVNSEAVITLRGEQLRLTPLSLAKDREYDDIVQVLTDAGAK